MELFLQPKLHFEKVSAASVLLPEDPNGWPQEVLQELYKQVPFIHEFSPHVEMDKVDAEKGYGFGHITITTQTEMQQGADPASQAAAGIKEIKIPVIIKDNRMFPLDTLITADAKMYPLTEDRLRAAVFRPQAFDVTSKTPGDQSMIGQLYPPYRQNYGGGGGIAMGIGKEGAANRATLAKERSMPKISPDDADALMVMASQKTASLTGIALQTANHSDVTHFVDTLRGDRDLQLAYEKNAAATVTPLSAVLDHTSPPFSKTASSFRSLVTPTVTQLIRTTEGYTLKTASSKHWDPIEAHLSRGEAIQKCGAKAVLAADLDGAVTETPAEGVQEEALPSIENHTPGPITAFGLYSVHTEEGEELTGYVFPNLIDADGKELPLALFSDGLHAAVQTDIIGTPTDGDVQLPSGEEPNGHGFFFSVEGDDVKATVPLFLHGSFKGTQPEEPTTHMGETFDGRPVELSVQPNLQTVVGTPEGRMLVPQHWQWMALNEAETTALVSSEEDFSEPEEAKQAAASVWVVSGGNCFSLRGAAVEKLASDQREFLDVDQALFLLAGLGTNLDYGIRKMGEATAGREPVRVKIGNQLVLAAEATKEAHARAEQMLAGMPALRRDLIKEAAMITDPEAVDVVLALGFVNPENVSTFISYLPKMEGVLSSLCELLVASRLGLNEIPDAALEKSVQSLEEVIKGLRALAFQGADAYN